MIVIIVKHRCAISIVTFILLNDIMTVKVRCTLCMAKSRNGILMHKRTGYALCKLAIKESMHALCGKMNYGVLIQKKNRLFIITLCKMTTEISVHALSVKFMCPHPAPSLSLKIFYFYLAFVIPKFQRMQVIGISKRYD